MQLSSIDLRRTSSWGLRQKRVLMPLPAVNALRLSPATEIAGQAGDVVDEAVADVVAIGNELYLMLGGLIR
jgi:hypothetical protein